MGKASNKSHPSPRRTEDTQKQNAKDEAVARDPDIGGVLARESHDVHMRDRDREFR